ncbi:MAG TPA: aldo/keto reductase [Acidimicrobiales bacterium]
MRHVEVGGARVSAIGLGTWQFGSREWGYGEEYAERTAGAIVARALDLGINLIDTAEVYAFGRSERIVGEAIAGRRDDVFLATKLFPVAPVAPVVVQRGRASARRLGVDVIDLYQVHWPNPVVPLGTTMDGMARLVDDGVVRHVGVSNFDADRWRRAEAALGRPVLADQVAYSLVHRDPERDVLPHAAAAGRLVIAHSPLAQGLLSGRYDGRVSPSGIRAANPLFLPENLERAQPLLGALQAIGVAHGATPAQVALAWVIRRPNVVAIPGASSVAQVESNAAAADLDLTDEEDARLTAASDAFRPIRGPGAWARLLRLGPRRP